MNTNDQTPETGYSIQKTIVKAAPSFITLIIVNALRAALQAAGITIDDQTLFSIAIAGAGAVTALINWIKNRKKTQ